MSLSSREHSVCWGSGSSHDQGRGWVGEAWQGVRRLGPGSGPVDSHLQPPHHGRGLPAPAPFWVGPSSGEQLGPGTEGPLCVQGQQWVALVVGVDPRAPAVPGGTETRVAPGWGVSTAGAGSGGLMWLTQASLRGKCWVASSPPPAKGLHLLNGPCGYAACLGPGSRGCRGCRAACPAREKSPPVNL